MYYSDGLSWSLRDKTITFFEGGYLSMTTFTETSKYNVGKFTKDRISLIKKEAERSDTKTTLN